VCRRHTPNDRRPLPQATPLPRCRLWPKPHPAKDNGDWSSTPAARPLDWPNGQSALSLWLSCADKAQARVQPFPARTTRPRCPSSKKCPAPPVARQRAATALPRLRPGPGMASTMLRPGFYLGPTPRLQRLTRARPWHAPATKPAPKVLPALVMPFASWVTWLGGCYASGKWPYVRAPARHSFSQLARPPELAISGVRIQKLRPYPSTTAFRRSWGHSVATNSVFGVVSQDTHRQALAGLSWLSFSQPRDLPAVPEPGQGPAPAVTSRRLPTPAHVQRTCPCRQARSPWADLQRRRCSPTLRHDGPDATAPGSFRIAPIPRADRGSPARERNAIG
jgi:hypothetical protein